MCFLVSFCCNTHIFIFSSLDFSYLVSAAVQCAELFFHRPVCGCRDGCHLSLSAIGLRMSGGCADWWSPLGGGVSSRRQAQGHAQPGATPEGVCAVRWQWVTVRLPGRKHCVFNGVMTISNYIWAPGWHVLLYLLLTDSCCTEEDVQDISHVPTAINKNEPWDKCGPLSPV